MRLTIDGTEPSWDLTGFGTFEALMANIYRRIAGTGRVVTRVEVDGKELTDDGETEMASLPPGSISELRVTTGSSEELLRKGLEGAIGLHAAIRRDIAMAVEAFRHGDGAAGQSHYLACVKSMSAFFNITGGILSGIHSGFFAVGEMRDRPTPPPSGETTDLFTRLLECQKKKDWKAMADLLEFGVVPNIEGWNRFLGKLRGDQAK